MHDEDRRIRKTRRALAAALIELTAEHPYESISIRDITDRADVGYATFFRHYDSKDDLMLGVFQDITRELESAAGKHQQDFFEKEGVLVFSHVRDNAAFYQSILDSPVFARKLKKLFAEQIRLHMSQHMSAIPNPTVPLDVAVNHIVAALLGLIEWWINAEMAQPVEDMARLYDRLVIRATWAAISRENQMALPWETVT